jgi:TetR/AcrR family transcriptional regulator
MAANKSSHPPTGGKSSRPPRTKSSNPPKVASGSSAGVARKRKPLRKEEIIAEATRLFAERGYEGASMADLAERVGLRKASLFHHFASKEELYATVLAQLMEAVKTSIITALVAEGSFTERLDGLTDALTATLSAQPHTAKFLVREAMDAGPAMKEGGLGRIVQDALAAALELAKEGQREGMINPDLDATHLIVSLIGVHFMPFAIGDIVERFTGTSPFHASFVRPRQKAVRSQVRELAALRTKA